MKCPVVNSPEWDALVARTDLHTAYATFIQHGDNVPYVDSRTNNAKIREIEKEFNLVKYSTIDGKISKRYRGFWRESAANIISQIRAKYGGDLIIKRISPSPGFKGEFGLKIEGFPISLDAIPYHLSVAEIQSKLYRDDLLEMYEEANETLLPHDPDKYDPFLEIENSEQRGMSEREVLSQTYDVDVVHRDNGTLRKITVKDKNREQDNKVIGMITIKKSQNYPNYASIGIVEVNKNFRGRGIATSMYKILMESLPSHYDGFVSPVTSRLNNTEISTIHKKLEGIFEVTHEPNGDRLFSKRTNTASITPMLDAAKARLEQKNSPRRDEINEQKKILMSVFPMVEEVIEDYNMPLLGSVHNQGKTIKINPRLMEKELASDTLFHEFGHIFIDIAGGMGNAKLKEARKALVGSELEAKVLARYPDLIGTTKLDKEVLAQALGEETYKVWADENKRSTWENILYDILNFLKNALGLERNVIRKMSKEMLKGDPIDISKYSNRVEEAIYEQRGNLNPKDPSTIAAAYKELSNLVEFEEESHTYKIGEEELMPVSTLMYQAGYGISKEEENDNIRRGQRLGTLIHKNAEAISNNVKDMVQTSSEFVMTEKGYASLKSVLNEVFGEKYTLLNEVKLPDSRAMVAGTADVIAIAADGKQYIFDFKTKDKAKGGFKYYDSTNFGSSQRTVNTLQQSIYRDIIKRGLGVTIDSLNIVPLVVDINAYGRIVGVELDRSVSEDGIIKLVYNPLAADLLRKRELEISRTEVLEEQDIKPDSIEFKNKMLEDSATNEYQKIYDKALDTFTESLSSARTKGHNAEVQRLEELLDTMLATASDPRRGIALFVTEAVRNINSMYDLYLSRQEEVNKGKTDVWNGNILMKWYEILSAYDTLEDVSKLILAEGTNLKKSQTARYRAVLDDAISKKNLLRDLYTQIGGEILAEALYPNITRVEREIEEQKYNEWVDNNKDKIRSMSKKEIKKSASDYAKKYVKENIAAIHQQTKLRFEQELVKAQEDIGFMARWLDTVLNSNDMVVAGMIKDFVIQSEKSRLEVVSLRQEMVPLLRELEKFQGYSSTTPVNQLYDFMLEKDENGKYTGHILSKYKSELIKYENEMMETTKHLPAAERNQLRKEWRKKNGVGLNYKAFNNSYREFAKTLYDEGKLTQEELNRFVVNLEMNFRHSKKVSDIVNPEAADTLIKWKLKHLNDFRSITNPKWLNPEWTKLEKILENPEDPRTKWYNFILKAATISDNRLPDRSKLHLALPALTRNTIESVQAGGNFLDMVKLQMSKAFTPHVEDVTTGQISKANAPIFFLPTYYTRGTGYNVEEQSYDLATLYFNFFKMASDYHHKNEIIGNMELTKKIVQEREYTVRDSKGNPIKKVLNKARDKELTKSGKTSLLAQQVEDYYKQMLYGQSTHDLGTLDILGLKLDKNKLIEKLSGFTAINMLGLNFTQAMANVNLGEVMQITEAMAGEYITLKDLHSATAFYFNPKNMGEVLADIGSRNPTALINQLNEKWDILNDYEGSKFQKSTRFMQLMQTNTLFFTSHMGEHFMQTRLMLAMLGKIDAKDKDGNVIGNMREMYSVEDGKLTLDSRVDLEQSNWSEERQILFGQKVKRVLARLHGEYSELGKIALQRYSLGRAALMFRKFMYPGYDRRWGGLKYNEFLEEFTEGNYRQFGRFLKNVMKDLVTLRWHLIKDDYKRLLPREQANINRALAETMFTVMAIILGSVATYMVGESDDDDERYVWALTTYLSKRTRSELLFFLLPNEAMKILVSPAASISTIEALISLLAQLIANPFDVYESGPWKGRLKISKKAMKLTPGLKQWYRLRDIEESISLFDFNR